MLVFQLLKTENRNPLSNFNKNRNFENLDLIQDPLRNMK